MPQISHNKSIKILNKTVLRTDHPHLRFNVEQNEVRSLRLNPSAACWAKQGSLLIEAKFNLHQPQKVGLVVLPSYKTNKIITIFNEFSN